MKNDHAEEFKKRTVERDPVLLAARKLLDALNTTYNGDSPNYLDVINGQQENCYGGIPYVVSNAIQTLSMALRGVQPSEEAANQLGENLKDLMEYYSRTDQTITQNMRGAYVPANFYELNQAFNEAEEAGLFKEGALKTLVETGRGSGAKIG